MVHSTSAEPSGRAVTTGSADFGFVVSALGVMKVAGARPVAGNVRLAPVPSVEVTR